MFQAHLSHAKALKRIGWCLKATRDMDLLLKPSRKFKFISYMDADFAGLYSYELSSDSACAKSRMGFFITAFNFSIVWVSKLQTETELSTM
ncbi:hypothetical protein ACHAW6_014706 [Cyclotella cf. meneghiniana]